MKPRMSVFIGFVLAEFIAIVTTSVINISFYNGDSYMGRWIESKWEALLKLRQDLKDPSNRLASWDGDGDGDGDCCKWAGVDCNNLTGDVLELNLEVLSSLHVYFMLKMNLIKGQSWLEI